MDTRYKITRHVSWSRYVTIITIVICLVFAGIAFWADSLHTPVILFTCIGICIISAFYYSPVAVTVDRRNVAIRRLLTPKHIPVSEIKNVCLFQTTMGDVRICGSGGFFGYYGWFRSREIGKYFAYVGKWKDTFLIELNSGRKYIISCNQPEVIVKSILDSMNK